MRELKPDRDAGQEYEGERDVGVGSDRLLKATEPLEAEEAPAGENPLEAEEVPAGENPQEIEEAPAGEAPLEAEEEAYYEARRRARHERARLRRKRKQRNRRLALLLAVILLAAGAGGIYVKGNPGSLSGLRTLFGSREKEDSGETEAVTPTPSPDEAAETPAPTAAEEVTETPAPTEEPTETPTPTPEPTETPTPEPTQAAQDERISQVLAQAQAYATQYDYDSAISLLQSDAEYSTNEQLQQAAATYQQTKDACVAWTPEQVTHIFYHSLIVDPSKAFDGDYKQDGYNQVMTTMQEFNQITQTMYERGYVMVSIYDIAKVDENGVMTAQTIYLPEGKTPFVLSQDDACYYHSQDGDGIATKLVVDEEGKVRNEYVEDDGSVSVGDYDVVPLIDRFVEAHPDFSYHGAKGIVALTGYDGILGYRTDISYQTRPDDLDDDKVAWLDAHPDFNLDTERAGAKAVADAMKAEGWVFASHTWGHKNMSTVSMERLETDTQNFKENVDPLIGGTDIIIFAFGADINSGGDYTGDEKFEYLKSQGYNYYCNVDSSKYFVQVRDNYFRMGRRNVDGYRMYYNPDLLSDLFDAASVFDSARPTPVPPMSGN